MLERWQVGGYNVVMFLRYSFWWMALCAACVLAPTTVWGQPDLNPGDPVLKRDETAPTEVSPERKERALKLLRAGNKHLEEADFEPALAIFKSALTEWDHPAIRFNMVVALFRLNRMVEAYVNLIAALRYGPGPFKSDVYAQALNYKTLLETSVAELVVVCAEPGARVTLDGRYLFTGPGQISKWVRVGEHQVVAQKPDRQTVSESLQVRAMRQNRIEIARWRAPPPRVIWVSRWDTWKPWAVTAAGAASLLIGVPLRLLAQSNMDKFDQAIEFTCSGDVTCTASDIGADIRLYDRARLQNRMAVTAFATGGVVLALGLTLVVLNRPQSREIPRWVLVPEVNEHRAVLWGTLSF